MSNNKMCLACRSEQIAGGTERAEKLPAFLLSEIANSVSAGTNQQPATRGVDFFGPKARDPENTFPSGRYGRDRDAVW